MNLIGYARVSTEEQTRDGRSLEIQERQNRGYCELHEHTLSDLLVDRGVSAGVAMEKRPAGGELRDRLAAGDADGFVVTRLDRAFRLTVDGLLTAEFFRRRGLTIHAVHDHIDTQTPDGWLGLTIRLAMSQYERDLIRARGVEISRGLREQGRAYGHAPYGCLRLGDALVRDRATWNVRDHIMRLRGEGLSYQAIATEMMVRKIPAPAGGEVWYASSVRGIEKTHGALEHIPFVEIDNEALVSADGKVTRLDEARAALGGDAA